MSSFGSERQLLTSPPVNGSPVSSVPAGALFDTSWKRRWAGAAVQPAIDGVIIAIGTIASGAVWGAPAAGSSRLSSLAFMLCVSSLVVFLLANDGIYRDEFEPLHIRQIECPLRVSMQASLLLPLMSLAALGSVILRPLVGSV